MTFRRRGEMTFDVYFQKEKDSEWNFVRIHATCNTERDRIFFQKKEFDFNKTYDSLVVPLTKGSS